MKIDYFIESALNWAANSNSRRVIEWLFNKNPKSVSGYVIQQIVKYNNLNMMIAMYESNNCCEFNFGVAPRYPMDIAAEQGNLEIIKWLNDNVADAICTTLAVYGAAKNNHAHVIDWLRDNKPLICTEEIIANAIKNANPDISKIIARYEIDDFYDLDFGNNDDFGDFDDFDDFGNDVDF